ncbi:protein PERCC1-like [Dreissena polymorpha]|uniref:Uncharacterized protein n=1 Tax=Dreissena polymorpha TaxID=45954 RepID=A0A9D4REF0_DREPO|nr:protein PERCC1-like [Dreissena polymorpha]XP_052263685.1 protein PERCC1-like [Dreissena polymorpha]XP_052263686.1 protein PERCC1-like [Dreissena polymorpha]XP_052263687.1 protein PERCC1-like [Dreissena polymorpha]KAH3864463.1 hypothetical protein DPMN_027481 [Dreissena polymorpha]
MLEVAGYGPLPHRFPAMHDRNAMVLGQQDRMTPSGTLTPLHPVPPRELQHTSVIKKLDHSVDSIIPVNRSDGSSHVSACVDSTPRPMYETRVSDAFMEDDFSDHDSHYSEDFMEDDDDMEVEEVAPTPDITKQLLNFATMVSTDIQKFFGRKKGEEDSCDIYEDKWGSTKSGRELYYADLMKIVHGEDKVGKSNGSSLLDISNSVSEKNDNRDSFSGKPDKKIGIGPLNDLFEYGLRHFLTDKKLKQSKEIKKLKIDPKKFENVAPMNTRKLPTSFWKEPGTDSRAFVQNGGNSTVLQTNNPPDFSDLLESWRLDKFNGDISSSEVSMSPESV